MTAVASRGGPGPTSRRPLADLLRLAGVLPDAVPEAPVPADAGGDIPTPRTQEETPTTTPQA